MSSDRLTKIAEAIDIITSQQQNLLPSNVASTTAFADKKLNAKNEIIKAIATKAIATKTIK